MKPHTLSMSKAHLARLCLYGFQPGREMHPRPSKAAQLGTYVHALIEAWFRRDDQGLVEPGPLMSEDDAASGMRMAMRAMEWLEPQRGRIVVCEEGVRYDADADTAKWGPRRGAADYNCAGLLLPGTLDLVIRAPDEVLEVVDVKTGQKANAHDEQIRAQGLAVARKHKVKRVRVGFLFPRLTKCDEPEWIDMDEEALDVEAGEIHDMLRRLPVAPPVFGDHCNRCDHRPSCPGWVSVQGGAKEKELEAAGFFE